MCLVGRASHQPEASIFDDSTQDFKSDMRCFRSGFSIKCQCVGVELLQQKCFCYLVVCGLTIMSHFGNLKLYHISQTDPLFFVECAALFVFIVKMGGGYELAPICPTVCPFIHVAVRLLYAVTFLNCADWPKGVCSSICLYVMRLHIPWLLSLFAIKRKTTFFTFFWHKLRFGNTFSSHSSANTSIILGDIIYF